MTDPILAARTAVEQAAIQAAKSASQPKTKLKPRIGPIRYNLEAFGVAILGAVLLKWFCLEAFQIPTSSMQPTLMGSSEAGVYDRLLVDKLTPAIREQYLADPHGCLSLKFRRWFLDPFVMFLDLVEMANRRWWCDWTPNKIDAAGRIVSSLELKIFGALLDFARKRMCTVHCQYTCLLE